MKPVIDTSGSWIRNSRRSRAWAAIAAAWSVFAASQMWTGGVPRGHAPLVETLIFGIFYLGLAVLGLVLAGRVARAGVQIGHEGVVVRGPLRTRSVGLESVEQFSPGLQGRGGNGTPCPLLDRQGRRAVGVWALGQRNIWFRYARLCREVQPVCDELNRLVALQRSHRSMRAGAD